jgi:hypothetical protein
LKTRPDQDAKIQQYIEARRTRPGWYNALSGRQCGQFVKEALAAGEIEIKTPNNNPNWIIGAVEDLARATAGARK